MPKLRRSRNVDAGSIDTHSTLDILDVDLDPSSTTAFIDDYAPIIWAAPRLGGIVAPTSNVSGEPLVQGLANLGSETNFYMAAVGQRCALKFFNGRQGLEPATNSDYMETVTTMTQAAPATVYVAVYNMEPDENGSNGLYGAVSDLNSLQIDRLGALSGSAIRATTGADTITTPTGIEGGAQLVTVRLDGADSWVRIGDYGADKTTGTLNGPIADTDKIYYCSSENFFGYYLATLEMIVIPRIVIEDEDQEICSMLYDVHALGGG